MGVGYFSSFNPLICYEIIFPHQAVNKNMYRPDFILTITNDAWYGDSAGPRQHFAQARFRAIEQGLPVIRSANTGISGAIDPYGQIIAKIELMREGSLTIDMPDKIERTYYGMFGDGIFLLMVAIGLCFSCVSQCRRLRK
jgi:apolipoprotein N-acyltransferase